MSSSALAHTVVNDQEQTILINTYYFLHDDDDESNWLGFQLAEFKLLVTPNSRRSEPPIHYARIEEWLSNFP